MNGPFKGMHYEGDSVCSASDPKFLGTYEVELVPALLNWKQIPFKTIIDIGAAEGYYAVGLSLLFPNAQIEAYETTEAGRAIIKYLSEKNKVSARINIHGHCDIADLHAVTSNLSPMLLIMDIEGGERVLLNPKEIPALQFAYIIVELHDCFDPGVGDLIKDRLSASHHVEEIWSRERRYSDFSEPRNPFTRRFLLPYLKQYSSEFRPEKMRWLVCTPKIKAVN